MFALLVCLFSRDAIDQNRFRKKTWRNQETRSATTRTRTGVKASSIDPYVSGCIQVRTFSCSLGLGSITYIGVRPGVTGLGT
jgi:hypothetical protein